LKLTTREKRGMGTLVAANTKMSKNWTGFLRVDDNKTELFHFLADFMTTVNNPDTLIFVTYHNHKFIKHHFKRNSSETLPT